LKHGVPQRSVLGPLLFVAYIYDPPTRIYSVSEPVLLADDTNVIISSRNFKDFSCVKFSSLSYDKVVCC
jgi:hypothetical protein